MAALAFVAFIGLLILFVYVQDDVPLKILSVILLVLDFGLTFFWIMLGLSGEEDEITKVVTKILTVLNIIILIMFIRGSLIKLTYRCTKKYY